MSDPRASQSGEGDGALREGTLIGGRFELLSPLGKGGMGLVWEAYDRRDLHRVAIKFLLASRQAGKTLLSRFEKEAAAARAIDSPYVVRLLDHGADPQLGPYLAMELLSGEDLGRTLEREGQLSLRDVGHVVVQGCRALEQVHGAGILHRDIKPENFFLCTGKKDVVLKLIDFGVAKLEDDGGGKLTRPGELLGTLEYMSPEHVLMRGGIDARADLYSVAVVGYRALTGKVPFEAESLGELVLAITTTTPVPPSRLREGVGPEIDAWFARALAREPQDRFPSAREMAEAFVTAYRGTAKPTASLRPAASPSKRPGAGAAPAARDEEPTSRTRTPPREEPARAPTQRPEATRPEEPPRPSKRPEATRSEAPPRETARPPAQVRTGRSIAPVPSVRGADVSSSRGVTIGKTRLREEHLIAIAVAVLLLLGLIAWALR